MIDVFGIKALKNDLRKLQLENQRLQFSKTLNRKSKGKSGRDSREDHISAWKGRTGVQTANKMAYQDDGVARVLRAYFSHLREATWEIIPGEPGNPESEQRALETAHAFFDFTPKAFMENLQDILGYVRVGFSCFEPEYKLVNTKFGERWVLWNWGWRNQETLYNWKAEGGRLIKVDQYSFSELERKSSTIEIEGKNLVIFTNEREGDNIFGVSFLRPIYGNYIRKLDFYENMMIGIEKSAMGIPVIETPPGLTNDSDADLIDEYMEDFNTNEKSYIRFPSGYKLKVVTITYDAEKILKAISKENSMMLKASLLEFLDFGTDEGSGSHALDASRAVDFIRRLAAFSKYIEQIINNYMIAKMENANYGITEGFSKISAIGIKQRVTEVYAKMLLDLVNADMLNPDDTLRAFIRTALNLPAEEIGAGDEDKGKVNKDTPANDDTDDDPLELASVTAIAKRTNPKEIKQDFDLLTTEYMDMYFKNTTNIKTKFLADLNKALKTSNPRKALNEITPGFKNQFAVDLKIFLTETVLVGRKEANKELKKARTLALGDDLTPDVRKWIRATANLTADTISDEIVKTGVFTALVDVDSKQSLEKTLFDSGEAIDKHIDNPNNSGANVIISKGINKGRDEGFLKSKNKIEGWQYVATLDGRTTDICTWLATRRVKANDPDAETYSPPNHYGCRSYKIPIFTSDRNTVWEGWNVPPSLQKQKNLSVLEERLKEARLL